MVIVMKKITKNIIVIVWICIIFSFSLQKGSDSGETSNNLLNFIINIFYDADVLMEENMDLYNNLSLIIRKLAHMSEYAILSLLIFINAKKINITFLITLVVACMDECIQLFIPGRSGSIIDVGIDMLGSLICLLFIKIIIKFKENYYVN